MNHRRSIRPTTVRGNGPTVEAIPLDRVRAVLRKYGIMPK